MVHSQAGADLLVQNGVCDTGAHIAARRVRRMRCQHVLQDAQQHVVERAADQKAVVTRLRRMPQQMHTVSGVLPAGLDPAGRDRGGEVPVHQGRGGRHQQAARL